MRKLIPIVLTGFMGVGKSSVARHVAHKLGVRRVDLDYVIEEKAGRTIAEIIDADGIDAYRRTETAALIRVLNDPSTVVLSLGGGAWTIEQNRALLKNSGFTSIWLEATFEHCWLNIAFSRKDRPLARNKQAALKLFEEREKIYCLADWHFVIRPDFTSWEVAKQIVEEIYS